MSSALPKVDPKFKSGDIVRVINPKQFIDEKKIANRDAVVEWVGPDRHGQFCYRMKVRFLKRNGRGKEFSQIMSIRDFVLSEVQP